MSVVLGILTFLLILVSVFMVLVILMQRAKSDGGVGAALGGGMAEAAFGGESGNVLSRATTFAAVAFFVLSLGLYLGRLHQHREQLRESPVTLPSSPELLPAPAPLPGETPAAPTDTANPALDFAVPPADTTPPSTGTDAIATPEPPAAQAQPPTPPASDTPTTEPQPAPATGTP